ncbi:SpdA protein [Streptomyces sp. WM6372]|nr:SpdA protein [Streptomyces sp. WM6372]
MIQAVIAGALSFAHLHDLAAAAGQDGWKAWAYPVSVDLLLVAAWRRMRTNAENRDAWLWFAIALVASLGANVATAGLLDLQDVPAWLRILVAGWPALAFLGGTLLAHAPAPVMEPEQTEQRQVEPAPDLTVERAPEAAPELPPAEPAPQSAPPQPAPTAAAMPVPPALLDHAQKIADAHQAQTGAPIDTATLRSRLGVPPALADAIAVQLT